MSSNSAALRLASPYAGLSYYTENRSQVFFGRDAERATLIANLRAARLTLLYAQTGVGKSSLLRAGVLSRLQALALRNLQDRGSAAYVPVVFDSWRDDPVEELIDKVERAIAPFTKGRQAVSLPQTTLDAALTKSVAVTDSNLLVMLDQFEEYLLYRPAERRATPFGEQLARCINRQDLRVNFLIAVREDAYAGLGDLFGGQIANVYRNYLHLEYLDRESAREAIVRPIDYHNATHGPDEAVTIELELVEAVLDEVRTGEVVFDHAGKGAVIADRSRQPHDRVETPYLQLVVTTLWDREMLAGSRTLRLSTLTELGGAREIVRSHLDGVLAQLSEPQQAIAVDIFHHLVTPSGTKIAHQIPDLAAYSGHEPGQVAALVDTLASGQQRILRPIPAPAGSDSPPRVEIFHDVLAPPILAWRTAQEQKRLKSDKIAAEASAAHERRRARTFRSLAAIAAILLVVAIVAVLAATHETSDAERAQHVALSRALAVHALDDISGGSLAEGALLAIAAERISPTADARHSLVSALVNTYAMTDLFAAHTSGVNAVSLSPAGHHLATAGENGTALLYDLDSHHSTPIQPGLGQLSSVAFSPTTSTLALAGEAPRVVLWDLRRHEVRCVLSGDQSFESVAFSPNGKLLAGASDDGTIRLWNPQTCRRLHSIHAGAAVMSVAFSPSGATLAAANGDNVGLWNTQSFTPSGVLRGRTGEVYTVAFSPHGSTLAAAGADRKVTLWTLPIGRMSRVLIGDRPFESIAFSPDGKLLAGGSDDDDVSIWEASTGTLLTALHGHADRVNGVAFGANDTLASGGDDDEIIVWALRNFAMQNRLKSDGPAKSIALSSNGGLLAASSRNATTLWSTPTRKQLATLRGHNEPVTAVAYNPTGTLLASGSNDGTVSLTRIPDRSTLRVLHSTDPVFAVAFDPGSKLLATGGAHGNVTLWNVATGRRRATLPDDAQINTVAFSPDGRYVASGDESGRIILWDVANAKRLLTFGSDADQVQAATFSPAGDVLATAGFDQAVTLWDPRTGQRMGDPLLGAAGSVFGIAFDPTDRERLVAASQDGTVLQWDLNSGLALPLATTSGIAWSSAMSANGATAAFGAENGLITLVRTLPGNITAARVDQTLCDIVRANLTRAEWRLSVPDLAYQRQCPSEPTG